MHVTVACDCCKYMYVVCCGDVDAQKLPMSLSTTVSIVGQFPNVLSTI